MNGQIIFSLIFNYDEYAFYKFNTFLCFFMKKLLSLGMSEYILLVVGEK